MSGDYDPLFDGSAAEDNPSTPINASLYANLFDSVRRHSSVSVSTPAEIADEKIDALYALIQTIKNQTGQMGQAEFEAKWALDKAKVLGPLVKLFDGVNSKSTLETFKASWKNMRDRLVESDPALGSDLFDFVMTRVQAQATIAAAEHQDFMRQRLDPSSDNFELSDHMKTMADHLVGPDRKVNIVMQGLSLATEYQERTIGTVTTAVFNCATCKPCTDLPMWSKAQETHFLVQDLDAVCKAGEMTLIVGTPGSGKSSLLQALATRFSSEGNKIDIVGTLKYNGNDMCPAVKRLTSLILPYEECLPLLTVEQTFKFANETSTSVNTKYLEPQVEKHSRKLVLKETLTEPLVDTSQPLDADLEAQAAAKRPGIREQFDTQWTEEEVEIVMRVLRLSKKADTLVGNALVRGCSGGERRRVSVGESLLKKAPVLLGDEITNGLDANSALHLVNALKQSAQILGKTVILCVLQPSPDIYTLFDRVIMLNEGQVCYSGRRAHKDTGEDLVLKHFESLGLQKEGHMPAPDFLDLVTGGPELTQRFSEVYDQAQAAKGLEAYPQTIERPRTPQEFNSAWKASESHKALQEEIHRELQQPTKEFDPMYSSEYGTSFMDNLKSVTARQWILMVNNKENWKASIAKSVIVGLIVGTMFFQLGDKGSDGRSMAGVFLFLQANLVFGTFEYLPTILADRSTFYNHLRQGYIRISAYVISQIIVSLPIDIFKAVGFGSIVYWQVGLDSTPSKFLYFLLTLLGVVLVANQLARCIGAVCPDLSVAQSIAPLVGMIFGIAYIGYLLSKDDIPAYFIWIYYLSPLQYSYQGMMVNQLAGRQFDCGDGSLAQMLANGCQDYSSGNEELEYYSYTTEESDKWFLLMIVFAFWIGLIIANIIGFEYIRYDQIPGSGPSKDKQKKITVRVEKPEKPVVLQEQGLEVSLSFNNLSYHVPVKAGDGSGVIQKPLLNGCFGYFVPGTATALMGSSGAGKSTLMDVLANMKTGGEAHGDVFVNHVPFGKGKKDKLLFDVEYRRYVGYVEQSNTHMESQTVREAFAFSCSTRLGTETQAGPDGRRAPITAKDKADMVEYAISALKLEGCADLPIRDLNSQQQKQTTIGVELVADPAILFLDEPTSGLDSVGALTVMECIQTIKESGVTVVVTIHQPSEGLFNYFDMLLMLKPGGHQVYFGPCPKRQTTSDPTVNALAFTYFQNMVGAPEWRQQNPADYILDFCDIQKEFDKQYQGSAEGNIMQDITESHEYYRPNSPPPKPTYKSLYALTMSQQIKEIYFRANSHFWRSPDYNFTRMMVSLVSSVFLGLMFWRLGTDAEDCTHRTAVVFLAIVFQVPSFLMAMNPIFEMKAVHFRERKSMCYRERAYFSVLSFVEIPYILVAINIFAWALLFMSNLNQANGRVLFYWLFLMIFQFFNVSFGQMVACLAPTPEVAQKIGPGFIAIFILSSGFMLVPGSIPNYWKWLYWFSPYHYALEALTANELQGQTCSGQTALILGQLDMDFDHRYRNLGIIALYALVVRIISLFALKYNETIKR